MRSRFARFLVAAALIVGTMVGIPSTFNPALIAAVTELASVMDAMPLVVPIPRGAGLSPGSMP